MKIIHSFLAFIVLYSCGNMQKPSTPLITTETLEITSFKADCNGTAQNLCLQVRKQGQKNWVALNNIIKGFTYEEGYTFTINVEKVNINPSKIPRDIDSVGYTFTKMIKKEYNPTIKLHDIWVVKSLNKKPIQNSQITLEIQLSKRKIIGNDSCNNFFGDIAQVTEDDISFEFLGRTKKLCADMTYANSFYDIMKKVAGYRVEKLHLYFLNSNNEEILKLMKAD